MEDIKEYRERIDDINKKISSLYQERLDVCKKIGEYKKKNNIPIYDKNREDEIINYITKDVGENKKGYLERLFGFMLDESKEYQSE